MPINFFAVKHKIQLTMFLASIIFFNCLNRLLQNVKRFLRKYFPLISLIVHNLCELSSHSMLLLFWMIIVKQVP